MADDYRINNLNFHTFKDQQRHWAQGIAIGASLMYFFDPRIGRRRRAIARDQLFHYWRSALISLNKASRDFNHRMHGIIHRLQLAVDNRAVSDPVLVQRIRSKLGRVVMSPHSIHVDSYGGHVTLSGFLYSFEMDRLLACVARVKGVKSIETRLQMIEERQSSQGQTNQQTQIMRSGRMNYTFNLQAPRLLGTVLPVVMVSSIIYQLGKRRFGMATGFSILLGWFAKGLDLSTPTRHLRSMHRHGPHGVQSVGEHPFTQMRMSSHH